MIRWLRRWWTYRQLKKLVLSSPVCRSINWDNERVDQRAREVADFLTEHRGKYEAVTEDPDRIRVYGMCDKSDAVVPYKHFMGTDGKEICVFD